MEVPAMEVPAMEVPAMEVPVMEVPVMGVAITGNCCVHGVSILPNAQSWHIMGQQACMSESCSAVKLDGLHGKCKVIASRRLRMFIFFFLV
jgi:hypothetical protein